MEIETGEPVLPPPDTDELRFSLEGYEQVAEGLAASGGWGDSEIVAAYVALVALIAEVKDLRRRLGIPRGAFAAWVRPDGTTHTVSEFLPDFSPDRHTTYDPASRLYLGFGHTVSEAEERARSGRSPHHIRITSSPSPAA